MTTEGKDLKLLDSCFSSFSDVHPIVTFHCQIDANKVEQVLGMTGTTVEVVQVSLHN